MEHEIFNSDDEIIVEQKHSKNNSFWKNLFSLEFIAIFFAGLSLCLSLLTKFLGFMFFNSYVSGIFFFLAFGCAFAGIILAIVPMVKDKKMSFSLQLILNLFAVLISVL